MDKTCGTCRCWLGPLSFDGERGACRRYPPMPITSEFAWRGATYMEADRADAVWPLTNADDWCGEHQPKEPTP